MGALIREFWKEPERFQEKCQEFHDRNNRNMLKHLLSHKILLLTAFRKREKTEILRQIWLSTAVIPVHIRNSINERRQNPS